MKIKNIITDSTDNVLGLGDDNNVYIWDEHTAKWELLLVDKGKAPNIDLDS